MAFAQRGETATQKFNVIGFRGKGCRLNNIPIFKPRIDANKRELKELAFTSVDSQLRKMGSKFK